nr:hypothetical protein [uncultured Draconibacterium sp.]
MKKNLLHFNEAAALKQLSELGKARDEFQEIVDEFYQIVGKNCTLKLEELKSFVRSGLNSVEANLKEINTILAKKHIPSGKIAGLQVDFEKLDQFLQLPDIGELVGLIEVMSLSSLSYLSPEYFKLENNTLSILEGVEDQIMESHKLYIQNEAEAERTL